MKGWDLKPLGVILFLAILMLILYGVYKVVMHRQQPDGPFPSR